MKESPCFLFSDQIDEKTLDAYSSRQLLGFGKDLMMAKISLKKGAIGALHSHPHVQSSYVASGVMQVTIAGESKILKAGDGYYVPGGVEHGCVCLEEGILIDVFTPAREDFI